VLPLLGDLLSVQSKNQMQEDVYKAKKKRHNPGNESFSLLRVLDGCWDGAAGAWGDQRSK